MAEYIEREKTVELLRSLGNRGYRREKGTIQDAIKMISSPEYTPAADVAPVVRCKYCKHQCKTWHADKRMKEKGYWIYSCNRNSDPFVSHTVNGYDDEYCCYGERKKGENDK